MDIMSTKKGYEFENKIFELLQRNGWKATLNRSNRIQQIDITASYQHYYILIEVKAQNRSLGAPTIEKLMGILSTRPPNVIGVIFSSSKISHTAIKYLDKIIALKLIIIFEEIDLEYIFLNKVGLNELFEYKIKELLDLGKPFVSAKDLLISKFNESLSQQIAYLIKFPDCLFDIPKDIRNDLLILMIQHKNKKIKYSAIKIISKNFDRIDKNEIKASFIKSFEDNSTVQIHSSDNFPDYYIKINWASAILFIDYMHNFPIQYQSEINKFIPKIISEIEEFLLDKRESYEHDSGYLNRWGHFEQLLIFTKEKYENIE